MTGSRLPVSDEEVREARRESYSHGGSVRSDLHTCTCGATWPDESPEGDGDDLWQDHVQACALVAAHAVLVPKIERALEAALDDLIVVEACWDHHDYDKAHAAFWRAMGET